MTASRRSLGKLLCFLMLAGASLAHAGSYEDFFKAIQQDYVAGLQTLLSRGFDANTVDDKGQCGLHVALANESLKVAKVLASWPQTDVNKLNHKDESALMLAALKGYQDLAEMLIRKGADVNKPGWTPLHYAASKGELGVINLLLEHNAYIDAESPNGTTPLMMAAMYGTPEAVNLLLQEGADPKLKNQLGLTALQFAQRGNRPDAIEAIAGFLRSSQPAGQW